ncbi:MAG TPA: hypothetical protein DDZ65_00730 [Firmicutes bacterium]|nr:hypothetical protein [Bacillota bacterium]
MLMRLLAAIIVAGRRFFIIDNTNPLSGRKCRVWREIDRVKLYLLREVLPLKRTLIIVMAGLLLLLNGLALVPVAAENELTLGAETTRILSQSQVWRHELTVTITPLTSNVLLSHLYLEGADASRIADTWEGDMKRFGTDRYNLFQVKVARIDAGKPSTIALTDLFKSPIMMIAAERIKGTVLFPFTVQTLENDVYDTAIIAFPRKASLFSEYISKKTELFIIRFYDPDNLFDVNEWAQFEYRLPLAYPPELIAYEAQMKKLISKAGSMVSSF